eukprot:TRINITY_DN3901_c0_g2_i1.p1 TRINITY_DN3901_c0_g2~~TRINITY_DN3901_c0_g2_i1.p1  ORF type:complete len:513 (-),score=39.29 TRINITY_DN3901_c0_g2_i1:288-1826(-)
MVLPQCWRLHLVAVVIYSSMRDASSAKIPTSSNFPNLTQMLCNLDEKVCELFKAWDQVSPYVVQRDRAYISIAKCRPGWFRDSNGKAHWQQVIANHYGLLSHVHREVKRRAVEAAKEDVLLNRFMGSLTGMAVADALGAPLEFLPAQDNVGERRYDMEQDRYLQPNNAFGLRRGQWTDDSSMGLCMADSLLVHREFDGSDMRTRFYCWWWAGYNNAFRNDNNRSERCSVGLGSNIAKSLPDNLRENPPAEFGASTEDSGNGSIMRLAAVALFFYSSRKDDLYEYARRSSKTTHPGAIAAEACAALAHLIVRALEQPPGIVNASQFLDIATTEYLNTLPQGTEGEKNGIKQIRALMSSKPREYGFNDKEALWDWKSEKTPMIEKTLKARGKKYNGYTVTADYLGSYAIDGLAMALWAVYHTTSFNDAVVRSVNMLGDADSHGSVTGQLAGALYGYSQIDARFIKALHAWAGYDIPVRALLLHHVGMWQAGVPGFFRTASLSSMTSKLASGFSS